MLVCGTNDCIYYTSNEPTFSAEAECVAFINKIQPMPVLTEEGFLVVQLKCLHIPFALDDDDN
jgi:hypothetical protein